MQARVVCFPKCTVRRTCVVGACDACPIVPTLCTLNLCFIRSWIQYLGRLHIENPIDAWKFLRERERAITENLAAAVIDAVRAADNIDVQFTSTPNFLDKFADAAPESPLHSLSVSF